MEPMVLASVALIYVLLQAATIFSFTGLWLLAAILPVPALCI